MPLLLLGFTSCVETFPQNNPDIYTQSYSQEDVHKIDTVAMFISKLSLSGVEQHDAAELPAQGCNTPGLLVKAGS